MARTLKDSFIYYYKSATGICSAFVLCFVFVIKSTFSAIIVNLFLSQRAAYKSNRAEQYSAYCSFSNAKSFVLLIHLFPINRLATHWALTWCRHFVSSFKKIKKVRQPELPHRKTQTPIAATQNQINGIMVSDILPVGIGAFTKFKSSMPKKGYNIPYINRKTISPKSLFGFV